MQVNVKVTNLTMTDALATFLEQRINHIARSLARFHARGEAARNGYRREMFLARVELGRNTRRHRKGDVYRAEITLSVPGRRTLRAEAEESDIRVAIDRMRDEILNEIRSWKEKKVTMVRRGGREMKRRIHKE